MRYLARINARSKQQDAEALFRVSLTRREGDIFQGFDKRTYRAIEWVPDREPSIPSGLEDIVTSIYFTPWNEPV